MDNVEAATLLHDIVSAVQSLQSQMEAATSHLSARLSAVEEACAELLERSKPRSPCIFCPLPENKDGHNTTRCSRFADPVAKSVQATKLGLCERCLKPTHGDDCGVQCARCGRPHNVLLCAERQPVAPGFKQRRP
ncbi:hypothetical protein Y032_0457g1818 [Ancylostoma ceylanicum]|uniref:Uncharacterized protein n=1 Tax=Ancylostoma ceylanicum TaxID=53326 RepID=A0A016WYE1_9BILA|nr:hypothetical protein Y032_0457g1818 [Ancylostoma ceylanicum]